MPDPVTSLTGPELRDLFTAAMRWLELHADQVNAVNVFPVPDGDTGTNMYLTMRSTVDEAQQCGDAATGAVLAAMSRGALMGARGNSGVILSQIVRGIAQAGEGAHEMDPAGLVRGLEEGAAAAYRAVTKPAEGTILTVIREVAESARGRLEAGPVDIGALMELSVATARESLARTPSLLPVLAEAGVVDAGAMGLCLLLEGALRHLKGEELAVPEASGSEAVGRDWLAMTERRHATEESLYGYCTELLISGSGMNPDAVRTGVLALGDSVLVVGDDRLIRVHVHTDDPGAALSCGTSAGSLMQVKVDNIRSQAEEFVQMHENLRPSPATEAAVSCVAVVAGEGMADVFRSVGCTRLVSGGPTMNPSTRDILDAVESCPTDGVIVLPNDKNIILAAEQAAPLSSKQVRVVPSRSMPQGIAALLAMSPEDGLDGSVEAMEEALGVVRTIEVTRAVRATSIGGIRVREGQSIAIVDDQLTLAAGSPEEAVLRSLEDVAGGQTSLITLYHGGSANASQAASLAESLRERFPAHEVEVVRGGQPHHDYIVSVE